MARRRVATKREILPDPKYHSELLAKFINRLMQNGKKSIAEKIVYGALEKVTLKNKDSKDSEVSGEGESGASGKGGKGALDIFKLALDNVGPLVEVRSRRVGGSTYQIPVEVRPARRQALAMRWLIAAAKKRSEKSTPARLGAELWEASQGRGGAMKTREEAHKMADANKAFAHYRW